LSFKLGETGKGQVMTRFDLYSNVDKRAVRRGDWPAARVFVWMMLTGALAFWATVAWFSWSAQ
jgi:hypothetical protein